MSHELFKLTQKRQVFIFIDAAAVEDAVKLSNDDRPKMLQA